jgi:urease accessory protein
MADVSAPPSDLLTALQHADSAFPGGGFAFSQGLEGFSALCGPLKPNDVLTTIRTQIRLRWASSDRIALVLAHRAAPDLDDLADIDFEIEAATLPEPLRTGSRRNGAAFLAAHARLGLPVAHSYRARIGEGTALGHLAVAQGLVWHELRIDETNATAMAGYQFAAGQTQAVVRLGIIGALDAQRILTDIRGDIAAAPAEPVPADAVLEGFSPLLEIAAMRHVRQETRLFGN